MEKVSENNNNNNCKTKIYSAYILKILASLTQGHAKVVIGARNRQQIMIEKQLKTNMHEFFMKCLIVSEM